MKHLFFGLVFALAFTILSAQVYTIETVPNNKLINNSYVSNPDRIISDATVESIDSLLTGLEKSATAQVAVVLLNSIGEEDIFDFSQALFNHWGIGQKQNDNGLLILLVVDQRTVRFHTGDGIEGLLPDATCKDIQRESMVPHFKTGNYDQAMLGGVREVVRILNDPESRADAESLTSSGEEAPVYGFTFWVMLIWVLTGVISFIVKKKKKAFVGDSVNTSELPKAQFTSGQWFMWFIVVPIIVMIALTLTGEAVIVLAGLYLYGGATSWVRKKLMDSRSAPLLLKKDYHSLYNYYEDKQATFSVLRYIFPIPLAFMYGAYKKKLEFFRNHPRDCKQCGLPLNKLDEGKDDAHLTQGQVREEQLKSVDYDVWNCRACEANEILIYKNRDSKYSVCPKCSTIAFHKESNRTLRAATELQEGLGEEIKVCKFCNHRDVRKYTIARIVRSSSSSGGSGGRSSSGGSWGGGRSSGGGASSSW